MLFDCESGRIWFNQITILLENTKNYWNILKLFSEIYSGFKSISYQAPDGCLNRYWIPDGCLNFNVWIYVSWL